LTDSQQYFLRFIKIIDLSSAQTLPELSKAELYSRYFEAGALD